MLISTALECETHTLSYLLFTYVHITALVELQKSTITKLHMVYHNILDCFFGVTICESTSYQCTLFDSQYCQSVIRKLVGSCMCRLDSSVSNII